MFYVENKKKYHLDIINHKLSWLIKNSCDFLYRFKSTNINGKSLNNFNQIEFESQFNERNYSLKNVKRIVLDDKKRNQINNYILNILKNYNNNNSNISYTDAIDYVYNIQYMKGYETSSFPYIQKDILKLNTSYGHDSVVPSAEDYKSSSFEGDTSSGMMLFPFPMINSKFKEDIIFIFPSVMNKLWNEYKNSIKSTDILEKDHNTLTEFYSFEEYFQKDKNKSIIMNELSMHNGISLFVEGFHLIHSIEIKKCYEALRDRHLLLVELNKEYEIYYDNNRNTNDKKKELAQFILRQKIHLCSEECLLIKYRLNILEYLIQNDLKITDLFTIGYPIDDLNHRPITEYKMKDSVFIVDSSKAKQRSSSINENVATTDDETEMGIQNTFLDSETILKTSINYLDLINFEGHQFIKKEINKIKNSFQNNEFDFKDQSTKNTWFIDSISNILRKKQMLSLILNKNELLIHDNSPIYFEEEAKIVSTFKSQLRKYYKKSENSFKTSSPFNFYLNDFVIEYNSWIKKWFNISEENYISLELKLYRLKKFVSIHLEMKSDIQNYLVDIQNILKLDNNQFYLIKDVILVNGFDNFDFNILLIDFYNNVLDSSSKNWVSKTNLNEWKKKELDKISFDLNQLEKNKPSNNNVLKVLLKEKEDSVIFLSKLIEESSFFLEHSKDRYFLISNSSIENSTKNLSSLEFDKNINFILPWEEGHKLKLILKDFYSINPSSLECDIFKQHFDKDILCFSITEGNLVNISDYNTILNDQLNFSYDFIKIFKASGGFFESSFSSSKNEIGKKRLLTYRSELFHLMSYMLEDDLKNLFPEIDFFKNSIYSLLTSLFDMLYFYGNHTNRDKEINYVVSFFGNRILRSILFYLKNSYIYFNMELEDSSLKQIIINNIFLLKELFANLKTLHSDRYSSFNWYLCIDKYWSSFSKKTGRFRYTLLSKRSNFTGRSVIVSGPDLRISDCIIPSRIALILFYPLLISKFKPYFLYLVEEMLKSPRKDFDIHVFKNIMKEKEDYYISCAEKLLLVIVLNESNLRKVFQSKGQKNCEIILNKDHFFQIRNLVHFIRKDPIFLEFSSKIKFKLDIQKDLLKTNKATLRLISSYLKTEFFDYLERNSLFLKYVERSLEKNQNQEMVNSYPSFGSGIEICMWLIQNLFYTRKFKEYFSKLVSKQSILLMRQPSLHRMSLQSFKCKFGFESSTIGLNLLVCPPFNADFDGDTMSVFLPQGLDSQLEASNLLSGYNNIISPSTSTPIISTSLDLLFGIYYLTSDFSIHCDKISDSPMVINDLKDLKEIEYKLLYDDIPVWFPVNYKGVKSTVGRLYIYYLISSSYPLDLSIVNKQLRKKEILNIITYIVENHGITSAGYTLDILNSLGTYWSYLSGLSVSYQDFIVPNIKGQMIRHLEIVKMKDKLLIEKKFMSPSQFSRKIFQYQEDIIQSVNNQLNNDISLIPSEGHHKRPGVFMLIESGSRGSINQLKQICGITGFVKNSRGGIVSKPIMGNLKEGLSPEEFYLASIGGRKGMIDRSLNTSITGYLHRLLNSAMKSIVINEEDCGTFQGISIGSLADELVLDHFELSDNRFDDCFGRVLAYDVFSPKNGKCLGKRNEIISKKKINDFILHQVSEVIIRSPLTCSLPEGVCSYCYGVQEKVSEQSLKLVPLGYPVGIIGAQAMGEPSTQLTMRTFHQGGTVGSISASKDVTSFSDEPLYVSFRGVVRLHDVHLISKMDKKELDLSMNTDKVYPVGKNISVHGRANIMGTCGEILQSIPISQGAFVYVYDGQFVEVNDTICRDFQLEDDKNSVRIFSRYPFLVSKIVLLNNMCVRGYVNMYRPILDSKNKVVFENHQMVFFHGDQLFLKEGNLVSPGDLILEGTSTEKKVAKEIREESYNIISKILRIPMCKRTFPIAYFDGTVSIQSYNSDGLLLTLTSDVFKISICDLIKFYGTLSLLGITLYSLDLDMNIRDPSDCLILEESFSWNENEKSKDVYNDQEVEIILSKNYLILSSEVQFLKVRDGSYVEEGYVMRHFGDLADLKFYHNIVAFFGIEGGWQLIGKNIISIYKSAGISFEPIYMECLVRLILSKVVSAKSSENGFPYLSSMPVHELLEELISHYVSHQLSTSNVEIPSRYMPDLYQSFQSIMSIKEIPYHNSSYFARISFENMTKSYFQAIRNQEYLQDQNSLYNVDNNFFMGIAPSYGTALKEQLKIFNKKFMKK